MKRGIVLFLTVLTLGGTRIFAVPEPTVEIYLRLDLASKKWALAELPEPMSFFPIMILAQAAVSDTAQDIPRSLRNNRYFTESLRLANLARLAYNDGDYDGSARYAEEAVRNARLSDDYIAVQLKIRETNNAITAAKRRLDQTVLSGASTRFPNEYARAQESYNSSVAFRTAQEYDNAIGAANEVIGILADVQPEPAPQPLPPPPVVVEAPPAPPPPEPEPEPEPVPPPVVVEVAPPPPVVETPPPPPPEPVLPAQYTVRAWNPWRDCLWNIAGKPWVYGDSTKWRIIYEANRAKFPQSDNPSLIHPGMVLDIPSIKGEVRRGMWDEKTEYPSLR
jgi:hypothetical protein